MNNFKRALSETNKEIFNSREAIGYISGFVSAISFFIALTICYLVSQVLPASTFKVFIFFLAGVSISFALSLAVAVYAFVFTTNFLIEKKKGN